jgi:hypothetical protein
MSLKIVGVDPGRDSVKSLNITWDVPNHPNVHLEPNGSQAMLDEAEHVLKICLRSLEQEKRKLAVAPASALRGTEVEFDPKEIHKRSSDVHV